MFGLFGGDKKRERERQRYEAFLEGLPPAKAKLYELMNEYPDTTMRNMVQHAIATGNDHDLRLHLQKSVYPRSTPEFREKLKRLGKPSVWTSVEVLKKRGIIAEEYKPDEMLLGDFAEVSDSYLYFHGEGHLLTVAPTRKGKGQAHIIPNLVTYDGSIVVLDLKGEAYDLTAWYRRMKGDVFKWAPFEEETDAFNPLDFIEGWEDAALLADLMIIPSGVGDPFWDNSAKALVTGLMIYVRENYPQGERNMSTVMSLLSPSPDELETMTENLRNSGIENLRKLANQFDTMEGKQLSSVFLTARTHLKEWDSPQIARATAFTSSGFRPADLLEKITAATQGEEYTPTWDIGHQEDGKPFLQSRDAAVTFYLIMPPQRMDSHGAAFRVVMTMMIKEVMNAHDRLEKERRKTNGGKPKYPVLFMMDELPQLGYIPQLEKAMCIAGGMSIRFWLFTQDVEQIEKIYKQSSTMLSNCRAQMFFRLQDEATPLMISKRLGKFKSIFGDEDWAVPPEELVRGDDFRDHQVVFIDGLPIRSRLMFYYQDEDLQNKASAHRPMLEKSPDRDDMEGRYRSANDTPPQLARYRQELARLNAEDEEAQRAQATKSTTGDKSAHAEKQDFGIDTPPGFEPPKGPV